MIIIGISGKKRSGKDTVASILKSLIHEKYPKALVERIAFADALKLEVAKACGVSLDYLEQHKENFRLILQGWGTDFRRNLIGKDYWLNKWAMKLRNTNAHVIFTPDVRFVNEADTIRYVGGILINVKRPNSSADLHPSENDLDSFEFDYTVYNTGTIQDLTETARKLLDTIILNEHNTKYLYPTKL